MTGNLVWTSFTDTSNQDRGMCLASGTANGEVCSFTTSRVHSGFVGNFFGFTVRKKVADGLTATGRIALWWPVETDRYRGYSSMSPDPRESYAKLEGRWGGLLAGRALGLHDRGGTLIDFLYVDGNADRQPVQRERARAAVRLHRLRLPVPGLQRGHRLQHARCSADFSSRRASTTRP